MARDGRIVGERSVVVNQPSQEVVIVQNDRSPAAAVTYAGSFGVFADSVGNFLTSCMSRKSEGGRIAL